MERGQVIRPLTDTAEEHHWMHRVLGDFFAWIGFFFDTL
jgi:hypothetical protein